MNILRSLAKSLPHPILYRLYHHKRFREEIGRTSAVALRTGLPLLESLDLARLKTSDTLFVLGSAGSINEISDEKWQIIGRHDSVGINFWPVHQFVPRFFTFENIPHDWHPAMYKIFLSLLERRANAYANTVKIITEVKSLEPKQVVFDLPENFRKNLYLGFSMPVAARNEEELRTGICYLRKLEAFTPRDHVSWLFKYGGSVTAMMALGAVMGYKRIVLCGVDLNKQNTFYNDRERYPECRDWDFISPKEVHVTARRLPWLVPAQSAVRILKELILDPLGIELYVENRISTLYPEIPLAPQSLFEELAIH